MAIARNGNSDYLTSSGSSSVSGSYTAGSGSNRLMAFGEWHQTTGADLTGMTYNSVAATVDDNEADPAAGGNYVYVGHLVAPATGSNTAAASRTGSANAMALAVADYTGVSQSFTAAVGSNGASSVTSVSITVDTTALGAGCWIFTQAAANQVINSDTNFTLLTTTYDAGVRIGDSNGSVGAGGSKTVTISIAASGRVYGASFAFPPGAAITTLNLSENLSNSIIERLTRMWTAPRSQSDVVLIGESTTRAWNAPRSPIDIVTITESVSSLKGRIIELMETMGILDSVSRTVSWTRNFTETVTIREILNRITEIVIKELVTITDSVSRTWSLSRALLDSVSIIEYLRTPLNWLKRTRPTTTWTPRTKP